MALASTDQNRCPSCGGAGSLGERCPEKVCQRRAYRYVPTDLADKQLGREPGKVEPLVGTVLGEYLVVDLVGQGGFGKVYLGLQMPLRKRPLRVAIKVLEVGETTSVEGLQTLIEKFESEADALAALSHPNIVRLLRYGVQGQTPYIVMEYVSTARSLRQEVVRRALRREPFRLDEVATILRQVTHGLEAAHEQSIVHRDIKPDNIMLQEVAGNASFVRILDFGLAKFVDERSRTSLAVGTPAYMAPEQLLKDRIGPWTDLYAVGVLAFELLTGRRAFQGTYQEMYRLKADPSHDPVASLEDLGLPGEVLAMLRCSMAYAPEDRYRSMAALRTALEAGLQAMGARALPVAIAVDALVDSDEVREAVAAATLAGDRTPAHPELGPQAFGVEPTTPAELDGTPADWSPLASRTQRSPPLHDVVARVGPDAVTAPPSVASTPTEVGEPTLLSPGRRRLRTVALVLAGVTVFLLALSWTSLGREPEITSFRVMGAKEARIGSPTVLRLSATAPDGDSALPVEVLSVEAAGEGAQFDVEGARPAYLRLWLPAREAGTVPIRIRVRTGEVHRDLDLEMPVASGPAPPPQLAPEMVEQLAPGTLVELLPEGFDLVAGLTNRVYVRLRDEAGRPVGGARLRIAHPSFDGDEVVRVTDPNGLASFSMEADQTWFRLRLEISIGPKAGSRVEEVTLAARPRQMIMKASPAVARPGETPRVKLRTWRQEGEAICELLLGDAVVSAKTVRTTNHLAWIEPGPLEPGRYDLQCYEHATRPDEAFASTPVIVAEGEPLAAIVAVAKSAGPPKGAAVDPPPGTKAGTTHGYWQAALRRPLVAPKIRLDTREADVRAATERQASSRTWILAALAAVLAVLLAWLADGILKSFVESRERIRALRAFAADEDSADRSLGARVQKVRAALLVILVAGAALVSLGAIVLVFLYVL